MIFKECGIRTKKKNKIRIKISVFEIKDNYFAIDSNISNSTEASQNL